MDLTGAFRFRSGGVRPFREAKWLESLWLGGGDQTSLSSASSTSVYKKKQKTKS